MAGWAAQVKYEFEKQQWLRVDVWDSDQGANNQGSLTAPNFEFIGSVTRSFASLGGVIFCIAGRFVECFFFLGRFVVGSHQLICLSGGAGFLIPRGFRCNVIEIAKMAK